jgi:putative type II/III system pilus formation protein
MMVYLAYCGLSVRAVLVLSMTFGIATAAMPALAADISIVLDQAKLEKLPDRVATIVVGNPLIADGTVQAGGLMVVTGKGYGVTNLLALDRAGNVLMEKTIEVRGPGPDVVVVYRGIERESYSCAPSCERRITLGDSPAYFDSVIGQSGSRNGQAQAVPASK